MSSVLGKRVRGGGTDNTGECTSCCEEEEVIPPVMQSLQEAYDGGSEIVTAGSVPVVMSSGVSNTETVLAISDGVTQVFKVSGLGDVTAREGNFTLPVSIRSAGANLVLQDTLSPAATMSASIQFEDSTNAITGFVRSDQNRLQMINFEDGDIELAAVGGGDITVNPGVTTGAFIPPVMTTVQKELLVDKGGSVVFDSDTASLQVNNGVSWIDYAPAGGGATGVIRGAFEARKNVLTQLWPNVTPTLVTFNDVVLNQDSAYDSVTNSYTCPVTGFYQMNVVISFSTPAPGSNNIYQLYVLKDGQDISRHRMHNVDSSTLPTISISQSFGFEGTAGDNVEIWCTQSTNSSCSIQPVSNGSTWTAWSGCGWEI